MATAAVQAGTGDVEAICDVLQAAFYDDPVMTWLLPDDNKRRYRSAGMFKVMLDIHYMKTNTVWTTPDQVGAALWAPPGHWKIPTFDIVKAGHRLLWSMGARSLTGIRFLDYVDKQHPSEPHWYLGFLGTTPAQQGKGVGSALLQPVLERCDAEGLPAYLESSKEQNIPFYSRHGFAVTGEIKYPNAPTLWPMWREPRT